MIRIAFCIIAMLVMVAMLTVVVYGRIVINLCLSIEITESKDEKFFICDSM